MFTTGLSCKKYLIIQRSLYNISRLSFIQHRIRIPSLYILLLRPVLIYIFLIQFFNIYFVFRIIINIRKIFNNIFNNFFSLFFILKFPSHIPTNQPSQNIRVFFRSKIRTRPYKIDFSLYYYIFGIGRPELFFEFYMYFHHTIHL